MLQNQINPHFLYNTLESIRGEAQDIGAQNIANMARMTLQAQAGSNTMGSTYLYTVFAALAIGRISLLGGRGGVTGIALGALGATTLDMALMYLQAPGEVLMVVDGIIILGVLAMESRWLPGLLADNTDVGHKIGEMAADFINNDLGGEAKVAVFTTKQNIDMMRRGDGIVEKLGELAPNADIGKDVVGVGTSAAETLLQKYSDLNVIWAYGDFNALEAAEAVNAAGKGGDTFGIFSCDATAEGLKKIADGDIFRGTVYMGDLVGEMCAYTQRLVEGETFDGPISFENLKVVAENVNDYL